MQHRGRPAQFPKADTAEDHANPYHADPTVTKKVTVQPGAMVPRLVAPFLSNAVQLSAPLNVWGKFCCPTAQHLVSGHRK